MDVNSHVMTVDENGIRNIISIERAMPVPRKNHVKTRIIPSLDPPTQTNAPHITDKECKEPPEYVPDEVLDQLYISEDLRYRVRWYECTTEEDTWKPGSHIPRYLINRY